MRSGRGKIPPRDRRKKRSHKVLVIHNAPGKHGKQEHRSFKTVEEARAYIDRNADRRLRNRKGLSADEAARDLGRLPHGGKNR